jgi:Ca-activated chloride channel family protein
MVDRVELNCLLNVDTVPAGGELRLVYLLVEVQPDENAPPVQAPVNMAVVLDVSESMRLPVLSQEQFRELSQSGKVRQTVSDGVPVWTFTSIPEHIRRQAPSNLEMVQSAIARWAGYFSKADRISLVAFAERAEVLLRGVPGSDSGPLVEALSVSGSIQLGDETDIAAGLEVGLAEVQRVQAQAPGTISRALVLTDGFTRNTEGVMRLARQAREQGTAVSTVGIGTDFNEKLLVELADSSLGNAYFARVPQEIPTAFEQELMSVQSVALRHVQVEVRTSVGVEVRRAFKVRPAIAPARGALKEGRTLTVPVGDLDPARPPSLLLELVVPPQPGGVFRIARLSVSHGTQSGQREQAGARDVVLNYSTSRVQERPDPAVMSVVERVMAYVLQTRALDDLAAGNRAAATQKLRAAATRLLSAGEESLARTVQLEAERIERQGQASPEVAKEIRYATRKLTTRLD